jgi:hypothetical protein
VGFLLLGYFFLLLPQGVVSKWSLETIKFNYHDMVITGDKLLILIPLWVLILYAILTGLDRFKFFLRPSIVVKKMSLLTRIIFQVILVLSASGMILVLWNQLHTWGWAGIFVVFITTFLSLIFSYFFMIELRSNSRFF